MTDYLKGFPRPRDVSLNEPVTLTLPAHIWLGFLASYGSSKWSCAYTSAIMSAVFDQVMDPVWLKEQEARGQEAHDTQRELLNRFLTGRGPDLPPNMTDAP